MTSGLAVGGNPRCALRDGPRCADPDLERALAHDGYVVVRLLSDGDARDVARDIAALYPSGVVANQPQSNWYLGLIDPDRDLAIRSASIVWDTVAPHLAALLVEARCHYTSVAIKAPGAAATPMHQHWPTTIDPFARRIGCWVLLSEACEGPGVFRLVPRSHQLLPFIRHANSGDYFEAFSERVREHYSIDIALQPGEAVLFEDSILHGTRANLTPGMRISAIANFIGADMRTAAILPEDDKFAVVDTNRRDGMAHYLRTGLWPEQWHRVATLPNRNRAITEAEFVKLLAFGRKASLDFDPLSLVRPERACAGHACDAGHDDRLSMPGILSRLATRLTRWR
ncbi:phytanoyl-CoA dioxygenase family protein [Sphingorhabdus soli]|uniref:Phytanoyl-CoA dioxygenase family protein n=1 Tax=Flavisphingopyxis soli TaxID=2601267 RepID=A0A5C6UQA2_9SPHN|nr:phytanoyl-CoA dioxygenase family protein [Sphingorhabdus soli]TXC74346.1 phytanoyl-CoA dioxygenase family protein [Sphingorhabdus soli]